MPSLQRSKANQACQRDFPVWKETEFFSEAKGRQLQLLPSLFFQVDRSVDISTEDDDDGELALWSPEVRTVELVKDCKGLGFSILDYQVWEPLRGVLI